MSGHGEVLFKSPGMFAGYFKDAAKTAEAMTPDGYVMTGDAGYFDESGHLKIIDRAKDVALVEVSGVAANGHASSPKVESP
jgi:long-chain acyl-CoA synthetase